MKNVLKYIVAALIVMCAFPSCRKAYQENFFLAVDHAAIDFPFGSGHSYVQVYSTGEWTVGFKGETPQWCHLDRAAGSGRGSFRVDVDDNLSGSAREVTVLVCRDDVVKEIIVKQKTVE